MNGKGRGERRRERAGNDVQGLEVVPTEENLAAEAVGDDGVDGRGDPGVCDGFEDDFPQA